MPNRRLILAMVAITMISINAAYIYMCLREHSADNIFNESIFNENDSLHKDVNQSKSITQSSYSNEQMTSHVPIQGLLKKHKIIVIVSATVSALLVAFVWYRINESIGQIHIITSPQDTQSQAMLILISIMSMFMTVYCVYRMFSHHEKMDLTELHQVAMDVYNLQCPPHLHPAIVETDAANQVPVYLFSLVRPVASLPFQDLTPLQAFLALRPLQDQPFVISVSPRRFAWMPDFTLTSKSGCFLYPVSRQLLAEFFECQQLKSVELDGRVLREMETDDRDGVIEAALMPRVAMEDLIFGAKAMRESLIAAGCHL